MQVTLSPQNWPFTNYQLHQHTNPGGNEFLWKGCPLSPCIHREEWWHFWKTILREPTSWELPPHSYLCPEWPIEWLTSQWFMWTKVLNAPILGALSTTEWKHIIWNGSVVSDLCGQKFHHSTIRWPFNYTLNEKNVFDLPVSAKMYQTALDLSMCHW
jgi:hypothetical protein